MKAINLPILSRGIFYIVFLLVFFWAPICYGQTKETYQLNKIVPSNPEAAKFANYFYTPSISATGSVPIDIPLYELEVDGVKIPITLSYQTSGIRVTDLSGSVGLGWSLNVGGGVYRSINGLPDDKQDNASTFLSPWTSMSNYLAGVVDATTWENQSTLEAIISNSQYDMNQDNYSYNFIGGTGGLFFNDQLQLKQLNESKLNFSYDSNYLNYFLAKDDKGNSYKFNVKENTRNSILPGSYSVYGVTAWKLGEITTLHNKKVNFSYLDYTTSYVYPSSSRLYRVKIVAEEPGSLPCFSEQTTSSTSYSNIGNFNKLIAGVSTDDIIVTFSYSDNANASNWKKKLDKIVVSDRNGNVVKSIRFEYTLFSGDPRLKLSKVIFDTMDGVENSNYSFLYEEGDMPPVNTLAKDLFGFYNGYNNTNLLKAQVPYYVEGVYDAHREVSENFAKIGSLRQVNYPTSGGLRLYYEANQSGEHFSPGIRINKLELFDSNGTVVNTKLYEYGGVQGLRVKFPDYAIMDNPIDPQLFQSGNCFSFSSEKTVQQYHLPSNFFYEHVVIKEIGNGEESTTVEYYSEPYVNQTTEPLEGYVYQPILHQRELYRGNHINGKRVKLETFDYSPIVSQTDVANILEALPTYYSNKWLTVQGRPEMFACHNYSQGLAVKSIIKSKWIKLVGQSEQYFYDDGSSNASGTAYYYENLGHKYPTRLVSLGSNADTIVKKIKYPLDMIQSSSDPLGVYQSMHSLNMTSLPIISTSETGGQKEGSMSEYAHSAYSFPVLSTLKSFNPVSQQYEERVKYSEYDKYGQVLSHSIAGGPNVTYLWSYNYQYPIARIENASYQDVQTVLSNTVVQELQTGTFSDVYIRQKMELLRSGLPKASVASYTYKPLVGMTSMTDAKGMTTYYEYDSFQRLALIKDHYGNIIKRNCYNYVGQQTNCNTPLPPVYLNSAQSQSFTKNNCSTGEEGSLVTYTVAAGKYSSTVSQAAADAVAMADIIANGQAYANNNGTCVPASACKRYRITLPVSESNNLYIRYKPCGSSYYVTSALWQLEQEPSMEGEIAIMLCTDTPMYDIWFMYGEYGPSQIINGLTITEIGSCQ